MSRASISVIPFLALGVLLAVAATGRAQELDADQKQFFDRYQNLLDVADLAGVKNHAGRNAQMAEQVLDAYGSQYGVTRDIKFLEAVQPLAEALDEVQKGSRFQKRLKYLEDLEADQANKRVAAMILLKEGMDLYVKAAADKDSTQFRRALIKLDEATNELGAVKDNEWAAYARYRLGHCQESIGEYRKCVLAYDKAMDEWLAGGRPKDADYSYMAERRNDLLEKGYDPFAPEADPASGEAVSTGSSYKEGSEWQESPTSYKVMKAPNTFTSPSPYANDNHMLWRRFDFYDGVNPIEDPGPVRPFGNDLKVVKEGSKAFLDRDGDSQGDQELKIIDGKAKEVVIAESDAKGAPSYSMFMLTIGQSKQFLGHQVNYSGKGIFRAACYREGKILGQPFVLLDENCTGSFGDPLQRQDRVLRGFPYWWDVDGMILGRGKQAAPFSEFAKIGESWYRLKVGDPAGTTISTRELQIDTAFVQLKWKGPKPPTSLVITEVRDFAGAFFDIAGKKPVEVPAGRYEVAIGKIEVGKGANTDQAWILKGRSKAFDVAKGETYVLEMGGPYTFQFNTENEDRRFYVEGKSLLTYDKFGALVGRVYDDVVLPMVSVRTESGGSVVKNKEMRIISTEVFETGHHYAWFPADYEVEKKPSVRCQAQLTLKKHKLLGGPFTSEWQ